MKNHFIVISGFFKKEFAQVLRDPVMRIFLFAAPVIQLIVFGYAISNEFKNLKLAVFFEPPDTVCRQLATDFYASGWFVPVKANNMTPLELIETGKADAVLITQEGGLTKAYGRGGVKLQLLIDSVNATKARAIETYARAVTQKFIAGRNPAGIPAASSPVSFDVRVLYNPSMETAYFMIPAIMTMIMCIVTIILTGMSLAREKEMGTFETIIAAPLRNREIILGKTIPFVALGLIDAFIVIFAGVFIFNVPIRGPLLVMMAATLVFVVTTVSIGMLISTFATNQQQAMMASFLFLLPANLLSGVFFPIENMPIILRSVAYMDPLMYFVKIMRNIMLKGANPDLVWTNTGILFVICAVIITVSVSRFRQTLN